MQSNASCNQAEIEADIKRLNLQKLMYKLNTNEGVISYYLVLFERQARRANLKNEDYVVHLLGLLLYEITQLIAREPEQRANEYEHVKSLLLKKFKLSPENI